MCFKNVGSDTYLGTVAEEHKNNKRLLWFYLFEVFTFNCLLGSVAGIKHLECLFL